MQVISVDFDDTYTSDPDLFGSFIKLAIERGHLVICVTSRNQNRDNADIESAMQGIEIVYTNGKPKKEAVKDQGIPEVNIWIDDMPQHIESMEIKE